MGNPYNFGLFMTHCCLSGILFMTHCRFLGGFLWRILYLTHLIYHAYWIFCVICYICVVFFTWFLCNIYKICRQFYWVFVQFLGVIKCLNNPFFTICRIAHTKKPHRAKFGHPKPFARFNNPTQIVCNLNRCGRFRPTITNSTYEIIS